MKILHIDSGLFEGQSVSRQLSNSIVEKLAKQKDAEIIYRDLVKDPVPHLDAEALMAESNPLTESLIQEVLDADILVIGAPMYNFTIPTQLKAWFDRVLKAGTTFRYTENGPEGLLKDKTVYIASGRGGIYSEGEAAPLDFQEKYLRTALGFIGLTDVHVIRAEGVNLGEEPRKEAINKAEEAIAAI